MKKVLLVVLLALCFLVGCSEEQKPTSSIKPLDQQLIPTRQDFKDSYGDTLQTQQIYNLAFLRAVAAKQAKKINKLEEDVKLLNERVPAIPIITNEPEPVDPGITPE